MKQFLEENVLEAAQARIQYVFDNFERVYVSFSGGKDSSIMLHLVAAEAIKRNRTIGVLFVDLEAQYKLTIEHVNEMYALYAKVIEPYWLALPLSLRNAVSVLAPRWQCWDPDKKEAWVRDPDPSAIMDQNCFSWFKQGMEFEELVPAFGEEYAQNKLCAGFIGIRAAESLNRWRTIAGHGTKFNQQNWINKVTTNVWNAYPIYDWKTEDLWTYVAKTGVVYNKLYDRMHQAGLTIHQMRICQPYGDDQRKGLWLYHIIEPETWGRVVARVEGANSGALYSQEHGNINGRIRATKPPHHTWESFAKLLLATMPPKIRSHYENKIAHFLAWYQARGYPDGIPQEASYEDEAARKLPTWRRVAKALLRNDYWMKGLSFSQTKSEAYERYCALMLKKRAKWKLI